MAVCFVVIVSNVFADEPTTLNSKKSVANIKYYQPPDELIFKEGPFKTKLERRHLDDSLQIMAIESHDLVKELKDNPQVKKIETFDNYKVEMSLEDMIESFKLVEEISSGLVNHAKQNEAQFLNDEGFKYYLASAVKVKILSSMCLQKLKDAKSIEDLKKDKDFEFMVRSFGSYAECCILDAQEVVETDSRRLFRRNVQANTFVEAILGLDVYLAVFDDPQGDINVILAFLYSNDDIVRYSREIGEKMKKK